MADQPSVMSSQNEEHDLSAFWNYPDWDGPLMQPFWMRPLKLPEPKRTVDGGYGGSGIEFYP